MRTRAKRNRITVLIDGDQFRIDHTPEMPDKATHVVKRNADLEIGRRDDMYEFYDANSSTPDIAIEVWQSFQFERAVDSLPHDSVVTWPESVSLGSPGNKSVDRHQTWAHAKAVCNGIMKEGLGGEKKVFPLDAQVRLSKGTVKTEMICSVLSLKEKAEQLQRSEAGRILLAIRQTAEAHNYANEAREAMKRGSAWIQMEPCYSLTIGQLYWVQRTQYEGEGIPDSLVDAPVLCRWEGRSGWSGYMPRGTSLLVWD